MIYAIRVTCGLTRYVKFGRARNPAARLRCLQSGSPRYKLRLLGFADWPDADEPRIHAYLWSRRVRGEWFLEGDETDHVVALLVDPDGLAKWHAEVLLPAHTLPKRLACAYSVRKSGDKTLTTAKTGK